MHTTASRACALALVVQLFSTSGCVPGVQETLVNLAGLEGPGGTTGVLAYDDAVSPNCAEGPVANDPPQLASPPAASVVANARVYLLRGLINTYSLGLDRLQVKMRELGMQAELVDWPTYETASSGIAEAYRSSFEPLDIFIIGHSYGSDDAVRMAKYLDEEGIPVKLLVLLDASAPPPITPNVDGCIHYYIPTPLGEMVPDVFAGNPVVLAPNNHHTQLQNIQFTEANFGPVVGCANHFSIDVNNFVHNLVIDDVLDILNKN